MRRADLVTPALLVDVDVMEANLATMSAYFSPRPASLRPHFKAHKCLEIARRQRELGAAGMTAQIPYEALALAEAGFEDILVSNQVLGRPKLAQLEAAAQRASVTVAVDSEQTIAALEGLPVEVLVEVNVGLPRGGAPPEGAEELARLARAHGLEVRGVQGYEGHAVGIEGRDARRRAAESAMAILLDVAGSLDAEVVSAGGTGTYDITGDMPGVTEVQAGSYSLMDSTYARLDLPFREALTVLATVTTVADGHYVLDAGLKAIATDHGPPSLVPGAPGEVWSLSDEHTTVRLGTGDARPHPGDLVGLRPSHVDPNVALHDRIWATRSDDILGAWPVARGWRG